MNPNQMNVAKAMVARKELLDEARRSRRRTEAESRPAQARRHRPTFKTNILGLLGLG
jgi:hypothetical protein